MPASLAQSPAAPPAAARTRPPVAAAVAPPHQRPHPRPPFHSLAARHPIPGAWAPRQPRLGPSFAAAPHADPPRATESPESPVPYEGALAAILLAAALAGALHAADVAFSARHPLASAAARPLLTRMLCGFAAAAASSAVVCAAMTPLLRGLKARQTIRVDGPPGHLSKAGTPTMGGVAFLSAGLTVGIACVRDLGSAAALFPALAIAAATVAFAGIGWLDDALALAGVRKREGRGMSPQGKLALQAAVSAAFVAALQLWPAAAARPGTAIWLPLAGTVALGPVLFCPLAAFAIVADSNGANLADGLDGLCAGAAAAALTAVAIVAASHPGLGPAAVSLMAASVAGAAVGFLAVNRHPAACFMGDTGSLALGGALAAAAVSVRAVVPLAVASAVFAVEAASVLAQVAYYKATKAPGPDGALVGKRLFRMAPLHHHLELSGWREPRVVAVFYAAALACAAAACGLPAA